MNQTDPYLVLLRRELIRAQARLRRCERERDALRAALEAHQERPRARPADKSKRRPSVSK